MIVNKLKIAEIAKSVVPFSWTDHNLHDPGITLLEHLAYAVSDLSYRLGFPMEDLLAEAEAGGERPFFSAREILPQAPLTLLDYRKLLLDCSVMEAGQDKRLVKNAWLTPLRAPEASAIRYDARFGEWRFDGQGEEVSFKGDYRVLIEPFHPSLSEVEKAVITGILHSHRNLGEDFPLAEIHFLEDPEYITLAMEIELEDTADPTDLYDTLRSQLAEAISPTLSFYTLAEMTARSKTAEDIFKGPRLVHGFIDDDELRRFDKKTSLRGSDLLHLVMNKPGVKAVRSILMSSTGRPEKQYLKLAADRAPRLAQFTPRFFKGRRPVSFAVPGENVEVAAPFPAGRAEDLHVPTGKYRNPGRFFSLTHDLPQLYGVGPGGLPAGAGVQRGAQALQLKAYIALFEQILANYLGQTAHGKDLFNIHYGGDQTYFPQFPGGADGIPGFETLRHHLVDLYQATEPAGTAKARMNSLLDHLLARFAEQVPEMPPETGKGASGSVPAPPKRHFLQQYAEMSYARGTGMDYTQWRNLPFDSGLEKRLGLLLDLEETGTVEIPGLMIDIYDETDKVPDGRIEYRFRVREEATGKILLSSSTRYAEEADAVFELRWALRQAAYADGYQRLQTHDSRHYFNIVAPGGEVIARRIEYFREPAQLEEAIRHLQELLRAVSVPVRPFYLVEHHLVRPGPDTIPQTQAVFPEALIPIPRSILAYEIDVVFDPGEKSILWCQSLGATLLKKGQEVKIFQLPEWDGTYLVYGSRITWEGEFPKEWFGVDMGDILEAVTPVTHASGKWIPVFSADENRDPWSLQFNVIFQGEILPANTIDQQREVYKDIIYAESPAHLTPHILWMPPVEFGDFERNYFQWRYKISHGIDASREIRALNHILGIARLMQVFHGLKFSYAGHLVFPTVSLPPGGKHIAFFFWAKLDAIDSGENVILKISSDPGVMNNQWRVNISSANIQLTCVRGYNEVEFVRLPINPEDFLGKWVHWGFVKDAENGFMQIYFNGVRMISEENKTIALPEKIQEFEIGNLSSGIIREHSKFSAVFADFQVWETADWAESIQEEIPFRRLGNEEHLRGYWKLDEGAGSEANDATHNQFTATINGTPKWV